MVSRGAPRRRSGSRPGRRVEWGGVAGRARPGRDVTSSALCIVGIPGPPRVVPVHWFQRSRAEGESAGRAGGKQGGVGGQGGVRSGPARAADRARVPHLAAARELADLLLGPSPCRAVVGRRNQPRPPGQPRQESSSLWDGCCGTSRKATPSIESEWGHLCTWLLSWNT